MRYCLSIMACPERCSDVILHPDAAAGMRAIYEIKEIIMPKFVSIEEAVKLIPDGASVMFGGFMGCGSFYCTIF